MKTQRLMPIIRQATRAGRNQRVMCGQEVIKHIYDIGHLEGFVSPEMKRLIREYTFPINAKWRYCPIEKLIVEGFDDIYSCMKVYDFSNDYSGYAKKVDEIKQEIKERAGYGGEERMKFTDEEMEFIKIAVFKWVLDEMDDDTSDENIEGFLDEKSLQNLLRRKMSLALKLNPCYEAQELWDFLSERKKARRRQER